MTQTYFQGTETEPWQPRQPFEVPSVPRGTAYISGPMRGLPEFNFPAFDAVAEEARAHGYAVHSPADNDRKVWAEKGVDDITRVPGYADGEIDDYLEALGETDGLFRWDFNMIINKCSHIIMLPGWERSTGARYERIIAEALGLTILIDVRHLGYLWPFEEDEPQSRLSDYLTRYVDTPALLKDCTPRELVTALKSKLHHVPGMSAYLEKVWANLA